MAIEGQAVIWPSKEHYPRFREVCDDGVHDTFEQFVAAAQPKLDALAAQGQHFEKLDIDPDAMAEWCRANFGKVDAHARGAYAGYFQTERARRKRSH